MSWKHLLGRTYIGVRFWGVKVTKVQAWCNLPGTHALTVPSLDVPVVTSPTFRIVGIILGSSERLATAAHFVPRLANALTTTRRLRMLALPASISALLWRVAVLPQALYGCEIRSVSPDQLVPLTRAGQAAIQAHSPLSLNSWRATDALSAPPPWGIQPSVTPFCQCGSVSFVGSTSSPTSPALPALSIVWQPGWISLGRSRPQPSLKPCGL